MKIIYIINSLKKVAQKVTFFVYVNFIRKNLKIKIDITIITLIDNGFYESELKKKKGIKIYF